jgi:mannose-1-phosphate guanylyltransferase
MGGWMVRTLTIMAGGGGVRFWPASRRVRPKQFLSLGGSRSLLQESAERALPSFGWSQISVITGAEYALPTQTQLPELPPENLLIEPAPRNTAACLALAAAIWFERDPQTLMAVTPADHLISPDAEFRSCIEAAMAVVERAPNSVCLLGITPTRPATGYGYIETNLSPDSGSGPRPVVRFREKPDLTTAQEFIACGRFLWNSGMFVWTARRFLELVDRYQPQIADVARRLAKQMAVGGDLSDLSSQFRSLPSISVDHAVLEPLSRETDSQLFVIPASFTWSDVGSWQTWPELWGSDQQGNTIRGPFAGVETSNCIVETTHNHLVATFGVEGLLIVHTPTATLVARRDDESSLRKLVAQIERLGHGEWL